MAGMSPPRSGLVCRRRSISHAPSRRGMARSTTITSGRTCRVIFSAISADTATVTSAPMYVINSVGWPVVSLFTLCVAASMAELASAYPTAGGLYFWAFRLGGRTWAWITAWLNMVGQVTITAGINVAAATYLVGAVTRIAGASPDAAVPLLGSATSWYFQLTVMVVLMVPQVLINVFGIRLTARLNDFSVWWHIAGCTVIVAQPRSGTAASGEAPA